MKSKIFLVGAGPGDPELITLKGLECIKKADVIIYDKLASKKLLKYSKKNCVLEYVGKAKGDHSKSQDEINDILVGHAKTGKNIVRLKGGDPFVFGRGSEEVAYLSENGFNCEVIPGVSSCYSVPELCGIPLTHRGIASGFLVVTGHESPKKEGKNIDWKQIAKFNGTIVVMMGKSNLGSIARTLQTNGLDALTPCAVIEKGSTKAQKMVTGTLKNITVKARGLSAPCVVVIGETVHVHNKKKQLELEGKRFLSTSSAELNKDIYREFKRHGADIKCVPMTKIIPSRDTALLRDVVLGSKKFDWLVFTSRHGSIHFLKKFYKFGGNKKDLAGKIACVGVSTANEFDKEGIRTALMPKEFTGVDLGHALIKKGVKGRSIALLRTALDEDPLKEMLTDAGASIVDCAVYNVKPVTDKNRLTNALSKVPEGILFLSPKAVNIFFDSISRQVADRLKSKSSFISIGPITTKALKNYGINNVLVPKKSTIKGMLDLCINKKDK